ncbi:MAG TPA: fibronectin type III domain-containing protein, partial [Polyangiaceae bacterium]|nr:fibronectin type III domain-containing protein [Polyangiaceae bacterium]
MAHASFAVLFLVSGEQRLARAAALAEDGGSPSVDAGVAGTGLPSKPAPVDPLAAVASDIQYAVTIDETTRWEPYNGTVLFSITGLDSAQGSTAAMNPLVEACFRWKRDDLPFNNCLAPERVNKAANGTVTFASTVPFGFSDRPTGVGTMFGVLPVAQLRIRLLDSKPPPPPGVEHAVLATYLREIEVTAPGFSILFALVFLAVAFVLLYLFSRALRVPGSNLLLRVISTPSGWASLSQFQIVLWTLLIAAGAVYVVTLTGSLLVLSTGTLTLLGIAGASMVGSQVQAKISNQQADGMAPAALSSLEVLGNPGPDSTLLAWSPVAGRGITYTVKHSPDGGTWITDAKTLASPRFRLVGLKPATSYNVRVFATNGLGAGASEMVSL